MKDEIASRDKLQELANDLRLKQSNVLPQDLIAHDHDVDDVLWNGPTGKIQRAGAFLIGLTLFSCALASIATIYEKGARLLLVPSIVIAAAGVRIIYKSFARSTVPNSREDRLI